MVVTLSEHVSVGALGSNYKTLSCGPGTIPSLCVADLIQSSQPPQEGGPTSIHI